MTARMSFSENTAAKRSLVFDWEKTGKAAVAASAAPAVRAVRRVNFGLISLPPLQVAQDQFGHHLAASAQVALRSHLALEDRAESVLVGHVEHAEGGDRLVHLDRVDVLAEAAGGLAALDDATEAVDDRAVERAHKPRFPELPPARLVLRDHQAHEARMLHV